MIETQQKDERCTNWFEYLRVGPPSSVKSAIEFLAKLSKKESKHDNCIC
jgi:hypothetical protein